MKPPQTRAQKNLRFFLRVAGLLLKGFAVVFLLLGLTVGTLIVALPRIIDGETARAFIVAQLEAVLRREVRLQGVILSPQGVKLRGLRVEARDRGDPFIEAESALVTIRLGPLLQRRLELGTVKLVRPRIRIYRDEKGWNFADLFTGEGAGETKIGQFALPVTLAAETSQIEGGFLVVDDRVRGTKTAIERFNLAVDNFSVGEPFRYELSFDNKSQIGERRVDASLSLQGSMSLAGFDWAAAALHGERGELTVDGVAARGKIDLEGFPPSRLSVELSAPALGPRQWETWLSTPVALNLPPSRWKLVVLSSGSRAYSVERLEAAAGAASVFATGLINFSTPSAPTAWLYAEAQPFPLDQAAQWRPQLAEFGLQGSAQTHLRLSGWPGRLKLREWHLRLRGLQARLKHQRVRSLDLDATSYDDFQRLAISLSRGSVAAYGQSFADIAIALSIVRRDLKVDYLSAKWEDSRVRLSGRVLNLADPKQIEVAGTLDRLSWERAQLLVGGVLDSLEKRGDAPRPPGEGERLWVKTFKYVLPRRFPDTVGWIKIGDVTHQNFAFRELELQLDLRGITKDLDTVSGDCLIGFGPGRVSDIQAVQDSHKFLKIVFLPYIYMHKMNNLSVLSAGTAYPKTLDFNRIEGQYGIEKGVVTTRFFHVDSPQVVAYADGLADFGRERVDMSILTRLTGYRSPLPEWWVDERGRPAIGFRVKGDLNRPDLEPRLSKMGANEIERQLEDGRSRAKSRLGAVDRLRAMNEGGR